MSTESDLVALANRVRDFVDQEIPNVTTWNINPDVLDEALRSIGSSFTTVETGLTTTNDRLDAIVLPDGTIKPIGEWVGEATVPVYLDTATFSLVGDHTVSYRIGSRIRATLVAPATVIAAATSVLYNPGANVTVIALASPVLTSALSKIEMSIVRDSLPLQRTIDLLDKIITEIKIGDLQVSTRTIADLAVNSAKLALLAVGTPQLADLAVTDGKVAFKSLWGSNRLQDNSIDASKTVTPRSITADRIVVNAITGNEVAYNTLSGWHITDLSIGAADIGEQQIFGGAYYRTHIASGSIQGDFCIQDQSIWAQNKLRPYSIGGDRVAYRTLWGDSTIAARSLVGSTVLTQYSVSANEVGIRAAGMGNIYGRPLGGNAGWIQFANGGEVQQTDWSNNFPYRPYGLALLSVSGNVCRTALGGGGTGCYIRLHRSGDAGSTYWDFFIDLSFAVGGSGADQAPFSFTIVDTYASNAAYWVGMVPWYIYTACRNVTINGVIFA